MFTGIVETIGRVTEVFATGTNKSFWIESPLCSSLKVDQSVMHDGVCLTVEEVSDHRHRMTAILETLEKTNLQHWAAGRHVNLERSLLPSTRVDGHFVQGHVDTTAICKKIKNRNGSNEFEFEFPKKFAPLIIEKGSVAVNGISLTAFDVGKNSFRVAVIPYTFDNTNMQYLKEGSEVNLEFDMIGKYMLRYKTLFDK